MTDNTSVIIIKNASVFNENNKIEKGLIVVINGKYIKSIIKEDKYDNNNEFDNVKYIDAKGKTLIPGFINCHTHISRRGQTEKELFDEPERCTALNAAYNIKAYLTSGITSIRDMGGKDYVDIAIRDFIKKGDFIGPRIIASGKPIAITGGHSYVISRQADGNDEVRKATREQIFAGADWIKVMASGGQSTETEGEGNPELSKEEMSVVVEEAHNHGKKVASHVHGCKAIKNSILAGVDTIEHGTYLVSRHISYVG